MRALHLFFQLHQPYSLKAPEGGEHEYFGGGADFREANQKYYQPFFALLERNTQRYPGLKVSLLVSGTWLDQAELYEPDLVRRLQKLVDLKQVELVATPYYYSLSAFYDKDEFAEQMTLFRQKFEGKFSTKCQVLAAPGLMYHDKLAKWAEKAGFSGALAGDGAGVLGFRNAGKVYDAAGCEDFRVLFENGKFSRALMRGEDLVTVESVAPAEDFSGVDESAAGDVLGGEVSGATRGGMRKKSTAAEFVRGRAGTVGVRQGAMTVRKQSVSSGKRMYSARKFQKELDIAFLRGSLMSLSLDARMFGEHREEGVVAFFDEFFANWLKVPGNKFLTASEALTDFQPMAEISVKSTVRSAGMLLDVGAAGSAASVSGGSLGGLGDVSAGGAVQSVGLSGGLAQSVGLARVEEVQYTLPEGFQSELEEKLYGLRERVLKTKNEDLRRDFQKLTGMDYTFGEARSDFEKVLEDFEALVDDLLPKPKQLRAENAGHGEEDAGEANLTASRRADELKGVTGEEEPEPEDDYTVKVHRILKKADNARQARPSRLAQSSQLGDLGLESGEDGFAVEVDVDEGADDGFGGGEDFDEYDGGDDVDVSDASDDYADDGDFDGDAADAEEMMEAFDAAEAEVQVIAQRMKRSRQAAEREFETLMEAEVVSVEGVGQERDFEDDNSRDKKGAEGAGAMSAGAAGAAKKKKTRRRIVLD